MRRISIFVLFAAAVALSACYPELEREPRTNLLCESDDACTGRQSCIAGLCGVRDTEPRSLAFRLLPTPNSGYRPQLVEAAPIDPSTGVDIGMEASVEVVGSVRRGGDGTGIAGTLVFDRTNARTPDSVQVPVGADGAYEALLSPGKYSVTMIPEGDLVPPFAWNDLDFRLDTAWDFSMPGESQARSVTVTTNLPAASTFGERAEKLLAARILAVSKETGVSSTAVNFVPDAAEEGSPRATLQVFAGTGAYDIKISPASPESLVPSATFSNAFVCDDTCYSTLPGAEGAEIISLDFEQDFNTLVATTFVLSFSSESQPTWEGVRARVTRKLPQGEIVVRPEVSADGTFSVESLAGDYTIDVLTPPDFPLASRRFTEVGVETSGDRIPLEMTTKNKLEGKVVDVEGGSVAEARIEIAPTASNTTQFAKPIVATTGTDGSFSIWLEPGDYWVSVIPLDAGLPRYVTRVRDETSTSEPRTWRLAEPTVLFGSVFGAPPAAETDDDAWKPVADVTVQALQPIDGELVVIGEGTTADGGDFRIAVPSLQ